MPKTVSTRSTRSTDDTRRAILEAAEIVFAKRGYALARLEDVGEAVGLTRPALFYHFSDKQTLYKAVLEEAFAPLVAGIDAAMSSARPIPQRIEDMAEAWVDGVAKRPSLSRLILRHVADRDEHPMQSIYPSSDRFIAAAWDLVQQGVNNGELKPLQDPFHVASAIIGTTVFYVTALSTLIPSSNYDPLEAEQIASHKKETLSSLRRLLGITKSRKKPVAQASAAKKRTTRRSG